MDGLRKKVQYALDALRRRRMLASIGLLVGGTGLAAVIAAAALPLLTRLYDPTDFGNLAAMTALIALISVSASLRFDIAIPLPERDEESINLLAVAVLTAAAISLLLCIIIAIGGTALPASIGQEKLGPYVWFAPLGVLAVSVYTSLQSWFIRKKRFAFIARNRVLQAVITVGLQIGVGCFSGATFGLLAGPILGFMVAAATMTIALVVTRRSLLLSIGGRQMVAVFSRYDRFPKYSTVEAFANVASIQIPILIIAALAPAAEAGFLLLAITVIQAPMGLLGNAIAQVFLSHAPAELRSGNLGPFTAKIFRGLMRSGVGPLIFGGILAPELFADIFGPDWRRAGILLTWMTPWFVMQYLVSPISMALHVADRQPTALAVQLLGVVLRVPTVYAATTSTNVASEIYALSGFVFYLIYLLVVLRVAKVSVKSAAMDFVRALPVLGGWIILAVALVYAVRAFAGTP